VRAFAALMVMLMFTAPACAANQNVQQSGNVTPGHVPVFVTEGVIQDGGTSAGGNVNTLGITANGGTPFCINDLANHSMPYHQICFGVSASGANIYLNGLSGAGAPPLFVIIGGVAYPFPSGVPTVSTPVRRITTGTSDSVLSGDSNGTIAWSSATSGAKTQHIFTCSSTTPGFIVTFKDENYTAGTYNVTITPDGGTIDLQSSWVMAYSGEAVTLKCDGVNNWMVQ
jgi:hypothetical protein